MKYLIFKDLSVMGVAYFADEAQQFAERFTGSQGKVTWTPTGDMLTMPEGNRTGWRVVRIVQTEVIT